MKRIICNSVSFKYLISVKYTQYLNNEDKTCIVIFLVDIDLHFVIDVLCAKLCCKTLALKGHHMSIKASYVTGHFAACLTAYSAW